MTNTISHEEYLMLFDEVLDMMATMTSKKNKDYASSDDAFANFNKCEQLGICSTEAGILTRITDKLQRVSNLLQRKAEVSNESIEDSCLDMAIYSVILYIYINTKGKERNVPVAEEVCESINSQSKAQPQMDYNHDANNVCPHTKRRILMDEDETLIQKLLTETIEIEDFYIS